MSTPKPYPVQLRFGHGQRRTFHVLAPTPHLATLRIKAVRELAKLLVSTGRSHLPEALEALEALTSGGDEFDALAAGIRELCSEPLPPEAPSPHGKTFRQLGEDWTSGRLAKAHRAHVGVKKSGKSDVQRLEVMYETIGDVPLSEFTLKHAQDALAALPDNLTLSTLRQYAQCIRRLLKLAVFPCQLMAASPLPANFCPKVNPQPKFVCIYPSEDAELLACEAVDFAERFLYGSAVRTGLRLSSLLDLIWRDVDFKTGFVRALCKDTKSGDGKIAEFELDPGTLRALKLWRETRKSEPATACIFPQWERTTISKRMRKALLMAGVDRHELHNAAAGFKPMRFHDLRASFVTFALANGRSEAWVSERTGHVNSQMIVRYKRARYAHLTPKDWLPLDEALGLSAAASEVEDVAAPDDAAAVAAPAAVLPVEALPLPKGELGFDGQDESGPARLLSQLEPDHQLGVGNGAAGTGAHEALREALGGVASRVASSLELEPLTEEVCSMISANSEGGSKGDRTLDLRIKSSASEHITAHESSPALHETTRERTRAHELPGAQPAPVSALDTEMLEELTALAVASKRWHLVAALGRDLSQQAMSRATRSNVTLLVDRRKGSK